MSERYIGIVSAEKQSEVNAACKDIDVAGGEYTATVPLVPESAEMLDENISHYIFNWNMTNEQIQRLRDKFGLSNQELVDYLETNYDTYLYYEPYFTVEGILKDLGLKKLEKDIL